MVGVHRLFDDDQTGKINFHNLKRVINMVGSLSLCLSVSLSLCLSLSLSVSLCLSVSLGCSGLLWSPHVSARLLHLVITVMTRCNISAWVVGGVFIFYLCDYFQDWLTSANIECF